MPDKHVTKSFTWWHVFSCRTRTMKWVPVCHTIPPPPLSYTDISGRIGSETERQTQNTKSNKTAPKRTERRRAEELKAQQICKIERGRGHWRWRKTRGHCYLNHLPLELRQIGLCSRLGGPPKSLSLSEEEASISQALKWKNQRHCKNLMRRALHCSPLSVWHNTSWHVVIFSLSSLLYSLPLFPLPTLEEWSGYPGLELAQARSVLSVRLQEYHAAPTHGINSLCINRVMESTVHRRSMNIHLLLFCHLK